MHCISLIAFLLVIYICHAQPTTIKQLEIDNTLHTADPIVVEVHDHNVHDNTVHGDSVHEHNVHVSKWEAVTDPTTQPITTHAPTEIHVKVTKDEHQAVKLIVSSGSSHYCHILLPFIVAGLMGIIGL